MIEIIKEIMKHFPEGKIHEAVFEGANIVLYTKDTEFFTQNPIAIREAVNAVKKRIELRMDPTKLVGQEATEQIIKQEINEEAGLSKIIFDSQRSIVIIDAEKPGTIIGKKGTILQKIKQETYWTPIIRRTPALKTTIIDEVRDSLYENSDYRRKFLDKVGKRIYEGWIKEKKNEWVRLTMLGGGRQVGRSAILLQTPESKILLDCGVNVAGKGTDQYPLLETPEFNIQELDAVIISHAHMDHIGFLPYLYKYGYKGPVYCTPPTRDIGALQLLDSIKILKTQNKEPIFEGKDVKEFVKHCITLEYDEVTDLTPDVRLTLHNAGHMIGSAMAHLHIGNGMHNFLYTGDMKLNDTQLLEGASNTFSRLESVMIESTYAGKEATTIEQEESNEFLTNLINKTIEREGKLLIPALGTGRGQEIMVRIDHLMRTKTIPEIPVYISGIIWDITSIHTAYPEYLNKQIRKLIFQKDENPFLNKNFKQIVSAKERKEIVENKQPCIIIATQGMLEGGPAIDYLKKLAENPKNTLALSCYQPEGTLGRRIKGGEKQISFYEGQKENILKINCEVTAIEGLSGHASRQELLKFIYKCNPRPKKIIINHGEPRNSIDLASSIYKSFRIETAVPRNLEAIRLR